MDKQKEIITWKKLTNKEIVKEWNLKDDIQRGEDAGYGTALIYKVIKGEVYKKIK